MTAAWAGLPAALDGTAVLPHAAELVRRAQAAMEGSGHGDLSRWRAALDALPAPTPGYELDRPAPRLGAPADDPGALAALLMALHPWRKGPLEVGGVMIDSEWRSDWKWARVAPHVELRDCTVLDVGCGNGYFGWRMLGAGARCVVGIDPTLVFVMQWLAQAHFVPGLPNFILPLRDSELPRGLAGFDAVFSMGVLYHRRRPERHLAALFRWLRPGGQLVLETLVLDDPGDACLVPDGRYARMRNVWHLPALGRLQRELREAGFSDVVVVDVTPTTTAEQRSTAWMRFESLDRCLQPGDPSRTVEGHPAPVRAAVLACRP